MEIDFANAIALIALTVLSNAAVVIYKSGKTEQKITHLEDRIKRLDSHIDKLYEKIWDSKL